MALSSDDAECDRPNVPRRTAYPWLFRVDLPEKACKRLCIDRMLRRGVFLGMWRHEGS